MNGRVVPNNRPEWSIHNLSNAADLHSGPFTQATSLKDTAIQSGLRMLKGAMHLTAFFVMKADPAFSVRSMAGWAPALYTGGCGMDRGTVHRRLVRTEALYTGGCGMDRGTFLASAKPPSSGRYSHATLSPSPSYTVHRQLDLILGKQSKISPQGAL
eukprot:1144916-Pelagomonas_calceolata.AAC.7